MKSLQKTEKELVKIWCLLQKCNSYQKHYILCSTVGKINYLIVSALIVAIRSIVTLFSYHCLQTFHQREYKVKLLDKVISGHFQPGLYFFLFFHCLINSDQTVINHSQLTYIFDAPVPISAPQGLKEPMTSHAHNKTSKAPHSDVIKHWAYDPRTSTVLLVIAW